MSLSTYVLENGTLNKLSDKFTPNPESFTWPDATNTGVQSGAILETYTGGQVVPPGTYVNMLFPDIGDFYIFTAHSNLVVRNCRFLSGATFIKCDDMLLEYCEAPGISFSSCHGAIARALNLSSTPDDFIGVTGDATDRPDNRCLDITIENCYLHTPAPSLSAHTDGIQARGVARLTIRNCFIDLGPWQTQLNAAIFLENANGGNSDVRISSCYLNGGGYIVRFSTSTGFFVLTDNYFGPDGQFGLYTLSAPLPTRQAGNFDDDNQPIIFSINN